MDFNPILCYFSPEILIFQELLIIETPNSTIGFGMPQTLYMYHLSHIDAFFPVKINKM